MEEVSLLKDVYKDHFLIGFAQDRIPADQERLVRHFNAVTPENALKWERVHPRPGVYFFDVVDQLMSDAESRGMTVIGHTLVWHNQTPPWVFQDEDGSQIGAAALLARMEEHIRTVAGRYGSRIKGWDVVNEAIADDGQMRQSLWYAILGEEFVLRAFEWAREACPDTELYYNDYGLCDRKKREGAIALVKKLQDAGARIDAVGIQGHFDIEHPPLEEVRRAIEDFAALGVKVMITELDMSVYPWTERRNLYAGGLPDELQKRQARRYADLFRLFREYSELIDRVTFWGLTDKTSWKNNFPVWGRTDHPLLFDRSGDYKPAFWAVLDPDGYAS